MSLKTDSDLDERNEDHLRFAHPMFDELIPTTLPAWPQVTARTILEHHVDREITAYHARQASGNTLWLSLPSLQNAIAGGSVRLGPRDLPVPVIDPAFARRAAAEAIADGVVIMFINGRRVSDLDEVLMIDAESRVRYVRILAQRGL